MRAPPFFSIVIPVSDTRFLQETLESCGRQTFRDFELVLSLDCDEELSAQVVRDTQYLFNDVSVVPIKNGGPAGEKENLYNGISSSRGLFIKILYHDDIILPNSLIEIHRFLSMNPVCDFCFNARLPVDENSDFTDRPSVAFSPLFDLAGVISTVDLYTRLRSIRFLNQIGEPSSGCFRADIFKNLSLDQFFKLSLVDNGKRLVKLGDLVTWINLSRNYRFGYLPLVLNYFRIHKSSNTGSLSLSEIEYQDNISALAGYVDRLQGEFPSASSV